jgi:hypothetical protein
MASWAAWVHLACCPPSHLRERVGASRVAPIGVRTRGGESNQTQMASKQRAARDSTMVGFEYVAFQLHPQCGEFTVETFFQFSDRCGHCSTQRLDLGLVLLSLPSQPADGDHVRDQERELTRCKRSQSLKARIGGAMPLERKSMGRGHISVMGVWRRDEADEADGTRRERRGGRDETPSAGQKSGIHQGGAREKQNARRPLEQREATCRPRLTKRPLVLASRPSIRVSTPPQHALEPAPYISLFVAPSTLSYALCVLAVVPTTPTPC